MSEAERKERDRLARAALRHFRECVRDAHLELEKAKASGDPLEVKAAEVELEIFRTLVYDTVKSLGSAVHDVDPLDPVLVRDGGVN